LPKPAPEELGQSLYIPEAKDFSHRKVDSGRVSLYPEHAGYFSQQNRVQQKICTFHTHSVHQAHLLKYPCLMTEQKSILVTAGIVIEGDRVLICQRHHSDPYGMQWEFPGGKVKEGEDLKASLRRELNEELAIQAEIDEEVFRLRHQYPDRDVEVVFFAVRRFRGTVRNQVFEAIAWVERSRLTEFNFLEADRELVRQISHDEIDF